MIFIGAGEDGELARATGRLIPGPQRDLTGATTLPRLTALVSLADVLVANDTGPLHLAVALDWPVVAPFTCTQVRLTALRSRAVRGANDGRLPGQFVEKSVGGWSAWRN